MAHSEKYPAISDKDIEIIDNFLSRATDGEIQNLETLDGFLTALIIGPEFVPPSEFIPIITRSASENNLILQNQKELETFFDILMRHYNHINETFNQGDIYMPFLLEDDTGVAKGNYWALGFMKGTELNRALWADLFSHDVVASEMIPIFALRYENDENPDLRPYKDPISDDQRKELLVSMIAGVKNLYDLFRAAEDELDSLDEMPTNLKTGRNDLCPCGSGKKFKKCCALKTFH